MTRAEAADSLIPRRIVDHELVGTGRLLRDTLVRVHPSFRFEERLARRLSDQAAAMTRSSGDAVDGPIPFPGLTAASLPEVAHAGGAWSPQRAVEAVGRVPRRVLIGGAIASGVSLAGAALLARRWRGVA